MNRSERRALARLPICLNAWEVALVQMPRAIDGVETEGMLLVVESGDALIRAAGPLVKGQSLWTVLGSAFTDPPPPGSPSRPKRVLTSDRALVQRLNQALKGVGVKVVFAPTLPRVEHVAGSMASHFGPVEAPGITTDMVRWGSALQTLTRIAPWQAMSDSVVLRFSGAPELNDTVAVVLGQAGEQLGVAVYPSELDYERFLDAAIRRDRAALAQVEALNLFLNPVAEYDEREVDACRKAGLIMPNGLCPRVMVLAGGVPARASDSAQRVLLAVIEAVSALTARGAEDLERSPARCVASTVLGSVEIRSSPGANLRPEPEPDLLTGDYAVGVGPLFSQRDGTSKMALIVKLRKPDALRLARGVTDVDRLQIELEGAEFIVRAWVGQTELGVLVRLETLQEVLSLARAHAAVLCVSAGGPKRPRISPKDFVLIQEVQIEVLGVPTGRHDPVFNKPVGQWPKVSQALLHFAEPLVPGIRRASESQLQATLQMACTVWNAVVMADYGRKPWFLDDLLESVAHEPGLLDITERMVERKRSEFAGDPRLLDGVKVSGTRKGDPRVYVEARLPEGYSVGE